MPPLMTDSREALDIKGPSRHRLRQDLIQTLFKAYNTVIRFVCFFFETMFDSQHSGIIAVSQTYSMKKEKNFMEKDRTIAMVKRQ
jgi:hypothetical protein